MKKKIKRYMIAISVISILLMMILSNLVNYRILSTEAYDDLRACAYAFKGTNAFLDPQNVQYQVEKKSYRVTLIAPDGSVCFDSAFDAGKMGNHKKRIEVHEALQGKEGYSKRQSDTMQKDTVYFAILLDNGYVLRVAKDVKSIMSVFLSSFPFMFVVLVCVIAVCIFLSNLLTKAIIQPVELMAKNIDQIDEADVYKELKPFIAMIRRQHEDIRRNADMRQEFTANVSHELKTPLTSMKVLADSINSMPDAPKELYQEFMEDITNEIERETKIINDLLSLVKMDKSAAGLNVSSVNINELLEQILKRLQPIADKQKVELVLESFRPVTAEVDEVKITLAITNLVENAIKYNRNDGEGWVHVSLNADHQYFYLKVEDSGIGIPEESLDHIYERFYRVDKSHSREIGGTGLGLAITRNSILMHRGAIKVHSVMGEGTTFDVRIPLNYIA